MKPGKLRFALVAATALAAGLASGCTQRPAIRLDVPYPVSLLLPREIRIHSFTGTKAFEDGSKGLEVHIEARDSYGDSTKAFGDFRFELHAFRAQNPDPKGNLIHTWTESLLDPKTNATHWWSVSRTYVFKLQSDQPIVSGRQYVLLAVFSSPYTERLFAQRVFTAGQ
jgi:hypothetical protein